MLIRSLLICLIVSPYNNLEGSFQFQKKFKKNQEQNKPDWVYYHQNNIASQEGWDDRISSAHHLQNEPDNKVWGSYTVNPACFEDGLPYAYSRTRNAKKEIKDNNVISNNMLCLDNALLKIEIDHQNGVVLVATGRHIGDRG